MSLESQVEQFKASFTGIRDEMMKMIVGQKDIVEGVLVAFFAGGHVLLEGVPGLGKTMLVRTLAEAVNLKFARVQSGTPDLMPADIVGTNIITEGKDGRKEFTFQPGPVFANILLADEINRATPKTQSALLEAMQEQHVTVGGTQHVLEPPFLVLATQNPLEMEAHLSSARGPARTGFFFKLKVTLPDGRRSASCASFSTAPPRARNPSSQKPCTTPPRSSPYGKWSAKCRWPRKSRVTPSTSSSPATRITNARRPSPKNTSATAPAHAARQALILAAKIHALLDGRCTHVSRADIDQAAPAALRHRIILNFEGEAEGTSTDEVIAEILKSVPR